MQSQRFLGLLLSVLAVVWLWLSYKYIPSSNTPGEPGPQAFPIMLGCALLLLGLLITLSDFSRPASNATAQSETKKESASVQHELRIVLGTFGLLMLYAFLMEKIGFLVSTPIVLALTLAGLLKIRRWSFIALLSSGITLVCWLVFVVLLRVPLPGGSWWWLV
ncbi:tripartite tricarboxylate transporter TctB family protein [Limnohabitans sp.]|jgi:putative tricarboxylic transport membrane protein|uniref:tripartite tricarboxylate transporter TctB family protein n=1 Tax=Limnohabitans sp. TaxID=1907725 RepID=UPI002AFF5635|nr:tripartite tricarboxylate transporter TctB family protein [Limnohabitans sp.]